MRYLSQPSHFSLWNLFFDYLGLPCLIYLFFWLCYIVLKLIMIFPVSNNQEAELSSRELNNPTAIMEKRTWKMVAIVPPLLSLCP